MQIFDDKTNLFVDIQFETTTESEKIIWSTSRFRKTQPLFRHIWLYTITQHNHTNIFLLVYDAVKTWNIQVECIVYVLIFWVLFFYNFFFTGSLSKVKTQKLMYCWMANQ